MCKVEPAGTFKCNGNLVGRVDHHATASPKERAEQWWITHPTIACKQLCINCWGKRSKPTGGLSGYVLVIWKLGITKRDANNSG